MSQTNAYYEFFQQLAKDERLTINGLAEKYNLGKGFVSGVYRMKDIPDRVPHPETIGRVEKNMGIKIDDSDINHIKYHRIDNPALQEMISNNVVKRVSQEDLVELPYIKDEEDLETIRREFDKTGSITPKKIGQIISKRMSVIHDNLNACVGKVITDRNAPDFKIGDHIVTDFDAYINSGDYVGVYLKSGNFFVGRYTKGESSAVISFTNPSYNPVVCTPSDIVFIIKVVKLIRDM